MGCIRLEDGGTTMVHSVWCVSKEVGTSGQAWMGKVNAQKINTNEYVEAHLCCIHYLNNDISHVHFYQLIPQ